MPSDAQAYYQPIRVAFLGGGRKSAVGRAHLAAIQLDGLFKLTAGCFSRNEKENLETARIYGVSEQYCCSSFDELIKLHKSVFDVVIVLTPTNQHCEAIANCVRQGIPVVCEKSMVSSLQEVRMLEELRRQYKGYLCVTYNYTGYPMIRELRTRIHRGDLGDLQQLMLEMPQEGFIRLDENGKPVTPQEWRLNDSDVPTVSLDLGAHLQMFVEFLTGRDATEVIATSNTYGNFENIEDSVSCIANYEAGMTSMFWYTKAALGNRNGMRLRIFGTKGSAEWIQTQPEFLYLTNAYGERSVLDRGSPGVVESNKSRYTRFKAGHPAGYVEAFANYYADVASDLRQFLSGHAPSSSYVFGVDEELKSMALMEAIHMSSRLKKWVPVSG